MPVDLALIDRAPVQLVHSVVIRLGERSSAVQKVPSRGRGSDGLKRDWRLAKVETAREVVSSEGGIAERRQSEGLLNKFQNAGLCAGATQKVWPYDRRIAFAVFSVWIG